MSTLHLLDEGNDLRALRCGEATSTDFAALQSKSALAVNVMIFIKMNYALCPFG